MSTALALWRSPRAVHDPAKVVLDLAIAVALGGDCAADLAVVRAQPQLFGAVASDATVSRLIATSPQMPRPPWLRFAPRGQPPEPTSGSADGHWLAFPAARSSSIWTQLWSPPQRQTGCDTDIQVRLRVPPHAAFVDYGIQGSGEALAGLLRPGSAGSNSAADHISVLDAALAQLPEHERAQVVVRR